MRIVTLDLIRFFAALSVVLYHYISRPQSDAFPLLSEATQYGYLGVPLFFIISGYVISLSANNRTAMQFGVSRFVRLYPALWAGILFTITILAIFTDVRFPVSQIFFNFTLLNDYVGINDIDGVYWTLKAELRFYAGVFLLLAFGVFHKHKIWLSVWLSLTITYTLFNQPFFIGWLIMPYTSSFFIAGIALFLIQNQGKNTYNHFILILSLVISSYKTHEQASDFIIDPGTQEKFIAIIIVWIFYALMYFLSIGKLTIKGNTKLFISLGALTYPLYLIHNLAGKAIIDTFTHVIPEEIMIFLVILLMLFAAWMIHTLIEKPLATPMKHYFISISEKILAKPKNNTR